MEGYNLHGASVNCFQPFRAVDWPYLTGFLPITLMRVRKSRFRDDRAALDQSPYAQTSTTVSISHKPIDNGTPTRTKSPNL